MPSRSARGQAPGLDFVEAMLTGLAPDGGLYVPERSPTLSRNTLAGYSATRSARLHA